MEGEVDWCATCGRQLAAKRITETIRVPAPQNAQAQAPTRSGTIRPKGRKQPPPQAPAQPATVLKTRTVYDSAPLPLYCSDRCRLADLQSPARSGALAIGHNPVRHPWRLDDDDVSLIPDCAVDDVSSVGTASSASSTSSLDGAAPELHLRDMDPSLAAIFRGYDFRPMPLIPGTAPDAHPAVPRASRRKRDLDAEYNGGIMMSGKRIQEWVHPEQPKPSRPAYPLPLPEGHAQPPSPAKPSATSQKVPNWNDGTNAWRASIYNLSSTTDVEPMDLREHYAYSTQVASAHRSSTGVVPSIRSSSPPSPVTSTSSIPTLRRHSSPSTVRTDPDALLLSKFSEPFSKRSESRQSLNNGGSPRPSSSMPEYREKNLVARGAEHALLVPDVKLRMRRGSHSRTGSSLPNTRSPLSMTSLTSTDEEETDGDDDVTLTEDQLSELKISDRPKRPTIESRPWSYDGYKTYTAMPLKRDVSSLWRW
ncbi:uncharacterized protein SCHCODRAFT_02509551 [Schizophyllum commune H4-8]|uniref:Uncharacterized protein n=1 Tax=Schizophyllum commune (strain H4-8 / FGSC 9210) TaxID=578458 RepID=D8QBS4_SCHCM|nr:uncharacterized protein SCHCODRAFT_02509551 [Schizophyllum commune H4-8]KAI5889292.1 hypothetical protein SCHCODRAFT_02509551 [Schizophyllum commune H4-8]